MYLVTADEMRKMDQDTIESFGLPGRLLMENAGRGATRMLMETVPDLHARKVAIVAGRGNNGGDGFVMARYLKECGVPVTVFLLAQSQKVQGDARANLDLLAPIGVRVIEIPDPAAFAQQRMNLAHQDVWVDAILGTGLRSAVKGYYHQVIDFINQSRKPVFAVDIPSGLNSDTGQVCGISIRADATATFAFAKIGHLTYPGPDYTGDLAIVDIGIPACITENVKPRQKLMTRELMRQSYRPRSSSAHKGSTGHLMVVAGSPGKTGAAALAGLSAMRIGAGLVTLGVPKGLNPVLETQVREVMTLPLDETEDGMLAHSCVDTILSALENKKCLAIGPGLGIAKDTQNLFFDLLRNVQLPVVVDADGITLLAEDSKVLQKLDAPVILTPHPGEMARLVQASPREIQEDRIAVARAFAREFNVHLVLKGAATVIAHPDGMVFVNTTGNPGMASGGMGDVLTGMIAGLVVQGYAPEESTHLGVWLHGAAADHVSASVGSAGFLASDVIEAIPGQLARLAECRAERQSRTPFLQGAG